VKRILILSPFFYPEYISTGKYNTELAKRLIEEGHDVRVICFHPIYPEWKLRKSNAYLPGATITRGGLGLRFPSSSVGRRLILELWYALFAVRKIYTTRKSYDIVISILPPSIASVAIKRLIQGSATHIGIVHDIQGILSNTRQNVARKMVGCFVKAIERMSFKSCDRLIFLSQTMKEAAMDMYRIGRIRSDVSYPFVTLAPNKSLNNLEEILVDRNNIVYSGALGEKQRPDNIVKLFLSILDTRKDVNCYIFSKGPVFERLRRKYRDTRIRFYPLVDESDLGELLKKSSVQLVPQDPELADASFPSKVPNILASNTKLYCITATDSELFNLLKDCPCFSSSDNWDICGNTKKILELLDRNVSDMLNPYSSILEKFDIARLVDLIVDETASDYTKPRVKDEVAINPANI